MVDSETAKDPENPMKAIREVRSIDSVSCWTDKYITIGKNICMISLFGSQTRVNTMRAIILKGETVYLQDCWTWKNAFAVKRAENKLKAISRQLAPGVAHCVIYAPNYLAPEDAFGEKIFCGDSTEQVMETFFHVVQKRYSTPFLPAWTEWLWDQMGQVENINALGFNQVQGVKFIEEKDLEERLFAAGAPLSGGAIETDENAVMSLKEFLNEFGEALRAKINLCPFYDPEKLDEWDQEMLKKMACLKREPFPAQANAILALSKGFYRQGKRAEILVGEMGIGKTICGAAVPVLNPRRNHRTIIMCPGHLVEKWMREIRDTVPHAKIVNLNNHGLKELFDLKGKKPQGMEFYVIGKERAKNHYAWVPTVILRGKTPYCPQCGKAIDLEELKGNYEKRKLKCPRCGSPLWQADRKGPRRYAKAEFIRRHLPRGTFDLAILDEVHECKSGSTAQGQAMACLAASARRTLALTGTLMGGYVRREGA